MASKLGVFSAAFVAVALATTALPAGAGEFDGVTVNVIANALMQPQVEHLSDAERADVVRGIPVGRFGQPREAAHAVLFLASDDAGYITGETMNLSGGRFMD